MRYSLARVCAVFIITLAFTYANAQTEPGCIVGCDAAQHPIERLTPHEYIDLVNEFANSPDPELASALEALLFYGEQSRAFVKSLGLAGLEETRRELLNRELAKTHVLLYVRLVDERGRVRALIDGAMMRIGEKTHMHSDLTDDLQALEVSGTVHRTGLRHIWTRL